MAALTSVPHAPDKSKVPGLFRPIGVHVKLQGPFQCLPDHSTFIRNDQNVQKTESHVSTMQLNSVAAFESLSVCEQVRTQNPLIVFVVPVSPSASLPSVPCVYVDTDPQCWN